MNGLHLLMTLRILDKTQNFLQLYLHHCGTSEVPDEFHVWCSLSLIAACVADRVWLTKWRGSKLTPNLYTFLIGPSGLGKGIAIDVATKFVQNIPCVNMYRGKTTAPYLLDYLGRPHRDEQGKRVIDNAKIYLITPELSMSLGSGPLADAFVKNVTELYTGGDYLLREGTRTHGPVTVRGHCINWLAGSTEAWLKDSVTKDAIEGGFFARIVTINASYQLDKRVFQPRYPEDIEEVEAHLYARVKQMTHLAGEFLVTPSARKIEEQWYTQRPAPDDEAMIPAWKREHDLVLKLAMLLCLADGGHLMLEPAHLVMAQRLSKQAHKHIPKLLQLASQTPETAGLKMVEAYIQKTEQVQHSQLLRHVSNRGINAEQLRQAISTLLGQRKVKAERTSKGATVYVWMDRRRMLE